MSKKQQTLFQSWSGTSKSAHSNPTHNTDDDILVLDSDDDDELMRQALEESLKNYPAVTNDVKDPVAMCGATSSVGATPIEWLPGFDNEAGATWIYPTNYPVRKYQRDIVATCLFENTLVALPTGLGKLFQVLSHLLYYTYNI